MTNLLAFWVLSICLSVVAWLSWAAPPSDREMILLYRALTVLVAAIWLEALGTHWIDRIKS